MFFKGSRYENVAENEFVDEQGRTVHYKRIRVIPVAPARRGHIVISGERLDLIAQQHFQDPERFWRICDANIAFWPDDLTAEAGRKIGIPSPRA